MTTTTLQTILQQAPIIPVIIIHDPQKALPLAEALAAGGITTLEITLRTPAAVNVIERLHKEIPTCLIGAGTITKASQFSSIKKAGAQFAVSPGIHPMLIEAAKKAEIPYLPAVATASDILIAIQHGLSYLKFFPADLNGGIKALKQFASIFPDLKFCPTGGINADNLSEYLALPNVISIGGSWLAPQTLIEKNDWKSITQLAKDALAIVKT